ncbi:hypothetical protein BSL78_26848 [Apostichopus japonicus]|uniref:Uncharacterized protein n=1 Tax=Stichopus japonicus TaxID=307972 RepID=A0A2G8JKR9_STIJA|nr:hypothetical protein BSL78_26848 [Apostichopus japonicus]
MFNLRAWLRWDGYNTTTWLHACEVRQPQTKRPLRRKPKRVDWPTLRCPEDLQRLDGVSVLRDDGSYGERLIVYINDPYNGNVITTCRQTLRYQLIVECASEQHTETMDEMPTPTSPRLPSPPPPFVPAAVEEQASPVPCSPGPPPLVPDVGAASTSKTSSSATTQSRSGIKGKSSTTTVKKQAAKIICFGRPESRICKDIPSTEESGDEEDTQGDQPANEVPEVEEKHEEEIKELKKTLTDFINESNKRYSTLLSKYCNLERESERNKEKQTRSLGGGPSGCNGQNCQSATGRAGTKHTTTTPFRVTGFRAS